jgi:hypothetical protein
VAFEWKDDIDQAAWWVEPLHPFGQDVGSVIPDVFMAYARVFHPVVGDDAVRRAWAEVAATNGRISHPEMQLHEIGRPVGTPRPPQYDLNDWINRAAWGTLPGEEFVALRDVLALHTATPDRCWCCVWDGYGQLHAGRHMAPQKVLNGPRVAVPGRAYYLLSGPLAEVPHLAKRLGDQSPNIWWPDDRAWCVATEIDFAWTYVGGSAAAIDAVLADDRIEALPAQLTDRFTYDSDLLNAALDTAGG